jgi:hypothetical protein
LIFCNSGIIFEGDLEMRPPISLAPRNPLTTPPFVSTLINWLEGFVTELDFNSVAIGTVIDTHYATDGVTFEALSAAGVGHVFAANTGSVPDPNDPGGSASHTIDISPQGGFNDSQGIIRATFKRPQLFVAIDVKPTVDLTEFEEADSGSIPFLKVFGVPPTFPHPGKPPLLHTMPFPLPTTDPNFETWRTLAFLSMSPTPNIGSIEFSCHFAGSDAPVFAQFDLLRFAHHLPLTEVDDKG